MSVLLPAIRWVLNNSSTMINNAVPIATVPARAYMNLGGNLKRIINSLATANAIEKPIAKTRSSGIPKLKKS